MANGLASDNVELDFITNEIPDFERMGLQQQPTLVVIDDFMSEGLSNDSVHRLFTRGRHLNLNVCFLSQNIYHQGKHSRTISINSDYLCIFSNCRDKQQIVFLSRQLYPNNKNFLLCAYEDATSAPYGHLFLDFKTKNREELRVRAQITSDFPIVYQPLFTF